MAKRIANQLVDEETGEIMATEVTVAPILWKTPYNHDTLAESQRTALYCEDPSKAQQQFKDEADINKILAKFLKTGDPTILNPYAAPQYRDLEAEFDLQDHMVTAYQVEQAWNALPKEARAILGTPAKFVEWYDHCLETGNVEGLRDIGLIPKEKPQEPTKSPPGGTPAPSGENPPTDSSEADK